MNRQEADALDRHITGNWGADFEQDDVEPDDVEPDEKAFA